MALDVTLASRRNRAGRRAEAPRRIRFTTRSCASSPMPASATFEALALEVFAHQFECIPAYRRVCEQRGTTPATVHDWRDIPPVPALAFKHLELRCGPAQRTFVSSGTTHGPEQRSRHALPDLRLYHAAAISGLKEFLFPDVPSMPHPLAGPQRRRASRLVPGADGGLGDRNVRRPRQRRLRNPRPLRFHRLWRRPAQQQ